MINAMRWKESGIIMMLTIKIRKLTRFVDYAK